MKYFFIGFSFYLGLVSVPVNSTVEYLYTTNGSLYQNWIDPQRDAYIGNFCFDVRANRDAFIMLSSEPYFDITDGPNFEIDLGCCLQSQIQLRSNGVSVIQTQVITPEVLNNKKFINYCINWSSDNINLNRDGKTLLSYQRTGSTFPIKVIGFRKWFDGGATWKFDRN